jgi:hypothetical protein
MKKIKKQKQEVDAIHLVTINPLTLNVLKHIRPSPGRMYIDLIRKRFHSPNRKQGYDCRYLGIDWIETDSFEVENYAVCSIELKKVWFTRENTVEKYKK